MKLLCFTIWLITVSPVFSKPSSFLFFGDFGTGTQEQHRVAKSMQGFCGNNACDFVALLGDNFYPNGVSSVRDPLWVNYFEIPYAALGIPFFAALGNHDYKGSVDSQIEYSTISQLWKMPKRFYSFSHGDIDFFVLDTNKFNKSQRTWLEDSLKSSHQKWRIVIGHHPIYSYGGHGDTDELKKELLPIIDGKVDFYLCGHDHNKQVIKKPTSSVTFIVSGAAAQTDSFKKDNEAIYTSSKLGFAHFFVDGNFATLKILDEKGDPEYTTVFEKN